VYRLPEDYFGPINYQTIVVDDNLICFDTLYCNVYLEEFCSPLTKLANKYNKIVIVNIVEEGTSRIMA
jgi:hypothetical protein